MSLKTIIIFYYMAIVYQASNSTIKKNKESMLLVKITEIRYLTAVMNHRLELKSRLNLLKRVEL